MEDVAGDLQRAATAVAFSSLLVTYAWKKRALSVSGCVAAWFVGLAHCLAGLPYVSVLFFFFFSSSKITKIGARVKENIEEEYHKDSARNYRQVIANGGTATLLCIVKLLLLDNHPYVVEPSFHFLSYSALICAFIGHFSCCNADTWSSEIGILAKTPPVSILTFKPVPAGTNGGVTALGLLSSLGGGGLVGLTFALSAAVAGPPSSIFSFVLLGLLSGLFGSLLDSVLGATLQWSGVCQKSGKVVNSPQKNARHISGKDILSNNQVNFISAATSSVFAILLGMLLFS